MKGNFSFLPCDQKSLIDTLQCQTPATQRGPRGGGVYLFGSTWTQRHTPHLGLCGEAREWTAPALALDILDIK